MANVAKFFQKIYLYPWVTRELSICLKTALKLSTEWTNSDIDIKEALVKSDPNNLATCIQMKDLVETLLFS